MASLKYQLSLEEPGTGQPLGMQFGVSADAAEQCHFEGCENPAVHECSVLIFCKEYGCGAMICENHCSRSYVVTQGKKSDKCQYVCHRDKARVIVVSILSKLIPLLFILAIASLIVHFQQLDPLF